jgi:solute carrier family 50 protein (sugar transporter)
VPLLFASDATKEQPPKVMSLWILEILATGFTVVLFAAPLASLRSGQLADLSHVPLLAQVSNCGLWIVYSLVARNEAILLVNSIGLTLGLYYIYIYLRSTFGSRRSEVLRDAALLAAIACGAATVAAQLAGRPGLGLLASGASVLMFGSPLVKLRSVLRSRSTSGLSLALSVSACLASAAWSAYGALLPDRFVLVPNLLGLLLAICQLCLFAVFRRAPVPPIELEVATV